MPKRYPCCDCCVANCDTEHDSPCPAARCGQEWCELVGSEPTC